MGKSLSKIMLYTKIQEEVSYKHLSCQLISPHCIFIEKYPFIDTGTDIIGHMPEEKGVNKYRNYIYFDSVANSTKYDFSGQIKSSTTEEYKKSDGKILFPIEETYIETWSASRKPFFFFFVDYSSEVGKDPISSPTIYWTYIHENMELVITEKNNLQIVLTNKIERNGDVWYEFKEIIDKHYLHLKPDKKSIKDQNLNILENLITKFIQNWYTAINIQPNQSIMKFLKKASYNNFEDFVDEWKEKQEKLLEKISSKNELDIWLEDETFFVNLMDFFRSIDKRFFYNREFEDDIYKIKPVTTVECCNCGKTQEFHLNWEQTDSGEEQSLGIEEQHTFNGTHECKRCKSVFLIVMEFWEYPSRIINDIHTLELKGCELLDVYYGDYVFNIEITRTDKSE